MTSDEDVTAVQQSGSGEMPWGRQHSAHQPPLSTFFGTLEKEELVRDNVFFCLSLACVWCVV